MYLHEVLDRWFEEQAKPRLRGRAMLVRYADDFVIVFSDQRDARTVANVLPKRFARYGLSLNEEKTRLVSFGQPGLKKYEEEGREPGTFDFLGFTHYWGQSRKGNPVVKRQTARDRLRRAIKRVAEWCRDNRHQSVEEQHRTLTRKLRGHYAYFGITGNGPRLGRFHHQVRRIWQKWLSRRSQL